MHAFSQRGAGVVVEFPSHSAIARRGRDAADRAPASVPGNAEYAIPAQPLFARLAQGHRVRRNSDHERSIPRLQRITSSLARKGTVVDLRSEIPTAGRVEDNHQESQRRSDLGREPPRLRQCEEAPLGASDRGRHHASTSGARLTLCRWLHPGLSVPLCRARWAELHQPRASRPAVFRRQHLHRCLSGVGVRGDVVSVEVLGRLLHFGVAGQ